MDVQDDQKATIPNILDNWGTLSVSHWIDVSTKF